MLLDPSLPGTGSFSGVVIASGPTGTVARTAFGFGLESEHHDLTVAAEAAQRDPATART